MNRLTPASLIALFSLFACLCAADGCGSGKDPDSQPVVDAGSVQALVGSWVGTSPDGADLVSMRFRADGTVLWQVQSTTHAPGDLLAKFELDNSVTPSRLTLRDFRELKLSNAEFLGIIESIPGDRLRIDGVLVDRKLGSTARRPEVFGPNTIVLTLQRES